MSEAMSDELTNDPVSEVLSRHGIAPPRCGFYVGPGWLPIVDRALGRLVEAGWDRGLEQVKQKFCQLRIYLSCSLGYVEDGKWYPNDLGKIVNEAADECDRVCEVCGGERESKGGGWGLAACNACKRDLEEKRARAATGR